MLCKYYNSFYPYFYLGFNNFFFNMFNIYNNLISYCDAPRAWGVCFQDSAISQITNCIELSNSVIVQINSINVPWLRYLLLIGALFVWFSLLISKISNNYPNISLEHSNVDYQFNRKPEKLEVRTSIMSPKPLQVRSSGSGDDDDDNERKRIKKGLKLIDLSAKKSGLAGQQIDSLYKKLRESKVTKAQIVDELDKFKKIYTKANNRQLEYQTELAKFHHEMNLSRYKKWN